MSNVGMSSFVKNTDKNWKIKDFLPCWQAPFQDTQSLDKKRISVSKYYFQSFGQPDSSDQGPSSASSHRGKSRGTRLVLYLFQIILTNSTTSTEAVILSKYVLNK